MKKLIVITIAALAILSSCTPDPEASFTYSITGSEVYFTNTSSNSNSYEWDFGDGYVSYDAHPVHYYNATGSYYVSMRAYGKNDKSDIAYATVNIISTDLTIYNPLPTLTDLWIDDVFVGTIDAYGSWTVYDILGESVNIYAETWGETTDYITLGEVLYWDFTENLYGGSQDLNLTINSDFYFLFMTNDGSWDFDGVYVNCSDVEFNPYYTADYELNIIIPNDGYEYNTGWFDGTGYVNAAAYYFNSNTYEFWLNPVLFWDNDYYLYLALINGSKKSEVGQSNMKNTRISSGNAKLLKKSSALKSAKMEIPKDAIKHISTGSKDERRSK